MVVRGPKLRRPSYLLHYFLSLIIIAIALKNILKHIDLFYLPQGHQLYQK